MTILNARHLADAWSRYSKNRNVTFIIVTMRSDFEEQLTSIPELQSLWDDNKTVLRVTPLRREQLRAAIEEPARAVDLRFHPEVVAALLEDIGGEPAALPLLQFTLRKLWETKT
jgi:DNA polymerase III delta subunit